MSYPQLTADLLRTFSKAALRNAEELLIESSLLLNNGHLARAYFLAVSCIEEAGKGLQAYDGQCRNLSNPAICTKIISGLESHSQKITYALAMFGLSSSDPRAGFKVAIDLTGDLTRGREPSMYSDLVADPDRVQTPQDVVRYEAARDSVRLAADCLKYAKKHVSEKTPTQFTQADDKIFAMKSKNFKAMLGLEDFWWYYIARIENGDRGLSEAVLGYERDYIVTGVRFAAPAQR